MRNVALSFLFLVASLVGGQAADICQAVALRDVPALDDPQSIIKRGGYDTAITQYRVDKKTGGTSFCSHGGYCYPTHILENGHKVEALHLTNCRIDLRKPYDDSDAITYELKVIRSNVSAMDLKYDDVDNRLIEMGLCQACASGAADHYVWHPESQCAQLTKRALEGDPKALKVLLNFPDYCNYGH